MANNGSRSTKERLLEAAGEVFAENGFHESTVAEICERAGANIAAVNYHFGGKENLYVQAWQAAFEEGLRRHPLDGGLGPESPPKERLKARMTALIHRVLDERTREFDIFRHEMAHPTGLLEEAHGRTIDPHRRDTFRLVGEILGPKATPGQVMLASMTVMAPVFHAIHQVRHQRDPDSCRPKPPICLHIQDLSPVVEHTLRFVLAGLEEMRRRIETGDWPDMELPEDFRQRYGEIAHEKA